MLCIRIASYSIPQSRIQNSWAISDNPNLTLETSQLYTEENQFDRNGTSYNSLPYFRTTAFSDAERAITGSFALSGDYGPVPEDGSAAYYWINVPLSADNMRDAWEGIHDSTFSESGWVISTYGIRPASSLSLNSVLFATLAGLGPSKLFRSQLFGFHGLPLYLRSEYSRIGLERGSTTDPS